MNHCRAVRVPIMMILGNRPFHMPANTIPYWFMIWATNFLFTFFLVKLGYYNIIHYHSWFVQQNLIPFFSGKFKYYIIIMLSPHMTCCKTHMSVSLQDRSFSTQPPVEVYYCHTLMTQAPPTVQPTKLPDSTHKHDHSPHRQQALWPWPDTKLRSRSGGGHSASVQSPRGGSKGVCIHSVLQSQPNIPMNPRLLPIDMKVLPFCWFNLDTMVSAGWDTIAQNTPAETEQVIFYT